MELSTILHVFYAVPVILVIVALIAARNTLNR